MKNFYFKFLFALIAPLSMNAQNQDTLVDVGDYKMHFNIIKGEGTLPFFLKLAEVMMLLSGNPF
ncbi:hypothetical protein [Zobellia laminariae]|uniref:hypothetical protein n=1 Tax=Zobellia laminariae TaxID=248906 RepID=UPI0026F47D6E|nr:hypothetical protein [Zobellia laminariae]WKX76710.1 hypothetical protein Q5W13_00585 [Zobellia laminariae]